MRRKSARAGAIGLVVLLLLSSHAPAHAQTVIPEPGLAQFQRGVAQYRSGDYASALYLFLMARAAGNRNPNLSYDIALTLYQLGRDEEARHAFEDLAFVKGYEDIAEYHLGLLAARAGNREAATSSLRRTAERTDFEPLRRLAAASLARLDGLLPSATAAAYAAIGSGFDSNAGYQTDELQQLTDSADAFAEGIGAVDVPLGNGLSALASVYAREYREFEDYSQQTGQLALRAQTGGLDWQAGITTRAEASWLGGERLHESATVGIEGRRALRSVTLIGHLASTRFVAEQLYPELDGWRHRAGVEFAGLRGAFGYDFELNERADLEDGALFASRSPLRHQLTARTSRSVADRVTLEWRARYRYSLYADADRFAGGVEQRRKDTLAEAGLGARWRLSRLWSVLTELRYGRNTSTLEHYEYRRGAGVVSVEFSL
jgi:hypothetical protein